ncbi:MAG: hypothetical protein RIF32_20420 [Leptospirales bacterium]|jgi:hypothetical protein
MLRVRLTSFLQLLWGSGFSAFNVAFVAFWLLWIPEAAWLVLTVLWPAASGAIPDAGEPAALPRALLDAAAIFAIYGLAYAVLFQLFFLGLRVTAAVLSHGQNVLARITPGLAVFLLVGEPLLGQADLFLSAPEPAAGLFWALAPPTVLISLAVGLMLIYVSPAFRGYNATFALAAALVARIVLFPVDPGAGVAAFLIYELTLLLTAFFVFITIQIRYRLHLWPNYESVEVPDRFVRIGGVIGVFCALLYVAVELPWFSARRAGAGEANAAAYFIPTAVWFVCSLQWTLTAWLLDRGRLVSLGQQKERVQAAVLRSLTIAIAALSAVLFAVTGFPRGGLAVLTATHSTSGELLYLTGMLLDRDGDGNSLWPGQDPDDSDPCVRADFRRACAKSSRPGRLTAETPPQADVASTVAVLHDPTAPRIPRPPARNIVLLTWVTPAVALPGDAAAIPIYFAANQPEFALRALLKNTNGIGESPAAAVPKDPIIHRGSEEAAIPLPSELARAGYRTICTGRAPGRNYFRAGHATHLDAGCQVFQPLNELARNTSGETARDLSQSDARTGPGRIDASNINRTVLEGLFVFERYSEPGSNFLWIHYEEPGPEDRAASGDSAIHRRAQPGIERETLYRLRQTGDVIIMHMRPNDYTGAAYLPGSRQPRELPEHPRPGELLRFAAGLRNATPGGAGDQIVALYNRSFSETWFVRGGRRLGWRYPELPIYTMRLDSAGMPAVFNSLTGLTTVNGRALHARE